MGETVNNAPALIETDDKSAREIAASLLTIGLAEKFEKIPPEYFEMEFGQLEREVEPTQIEMMLRRAFWVEVRRVSTEKGTVIKPVNIYSGICTKENFSLVVNNQKKLVYLLTPPRTYEQNVNHLIDRGMEKLMSVLDAKLVYSNGHMDAKATKTLLDVVAYFESRIKGGIKQKVDINSKNQNLDVQVTVSTNNMQDLDQKLAKMREDLAVYAGQELVQGLPERVKDVEETET